MVVLSQENGELFGNLDRLPKFGILYDSQKAQSKISPVIIILSKVQFHIVILFG